MQFVVQNSHVDRDRFVRTMLKTGELAADVGSVIYGEEAVEMGLIDRIGGLSDALEELHRRMDARRAERVEKGNCAAGGKDV